MGLQAFTRVDTHTGEAQTWFPGRRCFCEELVFVPGPNAATKEDDGYLLGLVYDAAKHKSFLSVSGCSRSVILYVHRHYSMCKQTRKRKRCWTMRFAST